MHSWTGLLRKTRDDKFLSTIKHVDETMSLIVHSMYARRFTVNTRQR